jgi:hypothetical protein
MKNEFKPKRGDIVDVSYNDKDWYERIFITELEGAEHPFIVVYGEHEDKFKIGEKFSHSTYTYMRKLIQKTRLTKEQIAEKLNITVEELEIID